MKHYICLEKNQIVYVYGTVAAEGFKVERADRAYFSEQNQELAVREFAYRNKLNGKTVVAALDSDIFFSALNLPKGKRKQLSGMARNELTHLAGKEQELVISFVPFRTGDNAALLTFSMLKTDFNNQLTVLKNAGISCQKVYALANCMGEMAARLFPDKERVIIAEVSETHVRLALIEKGYSILVRVIRLNVRHFCETGATSLLYDEISEQISKMIQFYKARNKKDALDAVILTSDVLEDQYEAAGMIAANLSLSCEVVDLKVQIAADLEPVFVKQCHRAIAVMAKDKSIHSREVNLLTAARRDIVDEWLNRCVGLWSQTAFVFAFSGMLLMGISVRLQNNNYGHMLELRALNEYIADPDRQEEYRNTLDFVDRMEQEQTFRRLVYQEQAMLQQKKQLDLEDYHAILSSLSEGSLVTGMRYHQADGIYEVDILAHEPNEFPDLIERIRETGVFASVTYQTWEQVTMREGSAGYTMTILAELGKGQENETE